jgi:hypothetical protein
MEAYSPTPTGNHREEGIRATQEDVRGGREAVDGRRVVVGQVVGVEATPVELMPPPLLGIMRGDGGVLPPGASDGGVGQGFPACSQTAAIERQTPPARSHSDFADISGEAL